MPDPNASSSSLSDVDLGEHIHYISRTSPNLAPPRFSFSESSRSGSASASNSDRERRHSRRQSRRFSAKTHLTLPPPRTSSQRRERFHGFDSSFGRPSIMIVTETSSSSPTPASRGASRAGRKKSPQPNLSAEGLTGFAELNATDHLNSKSSKGPPPLGGISELSAVMPVTSSQPRPVSMLDQVKRVVNPTRVSRFSESDLSPFGKGKYATPQSHLPLEDPDTDRTLAVAPAPSISQFSPRRSRIEDDNLKSKNASVANLETPELLQISNFATQLYITCYLIFFSIWGTLARIGLEHLCFYEGAPVNLPVVWANFSGTFILGFLLEDRNLFIEGWGHTSDSPAHILEKARSEHLNIKKTVPLYIGLATGFCGSFTSFSSFMKDSFLAISNNLPTPINHPYPESEPIPSTFTTVHRAAGYSVTALIAVVLLNVCLSISAYKAGSHLAIALNSKNLTPSIPFRTMRRLLDPAIVPLALLSWIGAIFLAAFPPDRPGGPAAGSRTSWAQETWRGTALFAIVFAPLGCLVRYHLTLHLNAVSPSFPLGTFAANVFGSAVLGMAFDLQHMTLGPASGALESAVGGGVLSCQVLQGVQDGFCGALTTVSTWVAEMVALRRKGYVYGMATVVSGICIMVIVCGSARWSVGWDDAVC